MRLDILESRGGDGEGQMTSKSTGELTQCEGFKVGMGEMTPPSPTFLRAGVDPSLSRHTPPVPQRHHHPYYFLKRTGLHISIRCDSSS